jgi:phosphoribosylamine--glycine ligase
LKVLLIGSGGREHALAWKLARSPRVSEVVAVPGNAGMASVARLMQSAGDPHSLLELARAEAAELVVVGPEAPLVAGLSDLLQANGVRVFGPTRAAARLEGSKAFAKEFMRRHGVPTAHYRTFERVDAALTYVRRHGAPVVVKDSGLAAGKGVTVAGSTVEAETAVRRVFERPNTRVVVEERLEGQEISFLVFTDGHAWRQMPIAQDYKQAEDGDLGEMTGGMGAVAPVELLDEATRAVVERDIIERTLAGLREDGIPYHGVLYFGIMLTEAGPRLLEYNVRFGDPETQVVMPLLADDLVDIVESVIDGRLDEMRVRWRDACAACVVMSAPGYPGPYRTGVPLRVFESDDSQLLFHAGTESGESGLVSSGGRVLNVVAVASDLQGAVASAYEGVSRVEFPGAHYRGDIGSRLLGRR